MAADENWPFIHSDILRRNKKRNFESTHHDWIFIEMCHIVQETSPGFGRQHRAGSIERSSSLRVLVAQKLFLSQSIIGLLTHLKSPVTYSSSSRMLFRAHLNLFVIWTVASKYFVFRGDTLHLQNPLIDFESLKCPKQLASFSEFSVFPNLPWCLDFLNNRHVT